MRKSSKFRLFLLFIAGIVFVVFVFIMQRQFNNPEFDYQNEVAGVSQSEQDEKTEDTDKADEEADTDDESKEEAEEADEDTDNSTGEDFQVTADLLNIRSGPSADSEVVATLVTGDIVQVIGEEDEYEWVEVTYQDVTGYANAGYLEPAE
ncbi:SH3 domain-containing protein [Oceanobacillus sojae]|uniref:SH3b domain-containing protein n=1 Tax=Oceanobacillus sojae TaxID=582851 RepID=A0A511ZIT4_9BACI|nr:SH3 domain-containing protein [Oceanobacillus sojae]GEN87358.1 hypothetical protein OSO01_20970 [Oceanobacillus sojae]